jgi:hypothetical protein
VFALSNDLRRLLNSESCLISNGDMNDKDLQLYSSHQRYVAVAYVNAESDSLSFQAITELMNAFGHIQVLPTNITEQTPSGPKNRVVFTSEDGWQIALLGKAFQIIKVPANPLTDRLGNFSDFCQQASQIFQISLEHFNKRAHRLAALREGYLREISEQEIADIVNRLLIVPNIYQRNSLKEWDWRAVTDIEREILGVKERVNTIAAVKRVVGIMVQQSGATVTSASVDRIQVQLDINTIPTNEVDRFGRKHVDSFYTQVQEWHHDLEVEIGRFILGD